MATFPFQIFKAARKQSYQTTYVESSRKHSYPFFIQAPLVLIGIYLLFYFLFLLRDIMVPVCFAGLIAILLNPLVNKLISWKVNRALSILLALLIATILVVSVIAFLSSQLASFSELAPEFQKRWVVILNELQQWIKDTFNIAIKKQMDLLSQALSNTQQYIGQTLSTVMGIIGIIVLLPIYVFLLLYYKPMIINFFYEVFGSKNGSRVGEVLKETKSAIQSYILGLLIEMVIVAAMNSAALLIIGVKYAILIGVIGAILNVIPYIGGLIAIAMPVAMSLVTPGANATTPLIIIGAYLVIQFIDNNIIVPKVVSSKVEVNAFISIIIVLLGGALWGVAGMFLSIPFVAILKIVFDRIEDLKPWGLLLGTDMNPAFSLQDIGTGKAEEKSVLNSSDDEKESLAEKIIEPDPNDKPSK